MDRLVLCAVLLCLLAGGAHSQLVCYQCNNCASNPVSATVCGSSSGGGGTGGGGPTLPTSPAPTQSTPTTPSWWLTTLQPTIATIPPWPRALGYVCYRIERYVPAENRYVPDRGCALQLATYETTCNSVTGSRGYRNCQFCVSSLCN